MKTIVIAALLGTCALSSQAEMVNQQHFKLSKELSSKAVGKEGELKQKIEVELYNLEMLRSQYKIAQNTIKKSPGNHEELDKDFAYFHDLLQKDATSGSNAAASEKAMENLKKDYARKHKIRAVQELQQQKQLAATMEKELKNYMLSYTKLKNQYKKYLSQGTTPELENLANKIAESTAFLKQNMEQVVENAARYKKVYDDLRA